MCYNNVKQAERNRNADDDYLQPVEKETSPDSAGIDSTQPANTHEVQHDTVNDRLQVLGTAEDSLGHSCHYTCTPHYSPTALEDTL